MPRIKRNQDDVLQWKIKLLSRRQFVLKLSIMTFHRKLSQSLFQRRGHPHTHTRVHESLGASRSSNYSILIKIMLALALL